MGPRGGGRCWLLRRKRGLASWGYVPQPAVTGARYSGRELANVSAGMVVGVMGGPLPKPALTAWCVWSNPLWQGVWAEMPDPLCV